MKRQSRPAPHRPRLFDEPERPTDLYVVQVDGASRGNPGPASYAVVIRRPEGALLKEISKYIGVTTNNVAEYYALIAALDFAAGHGIQKLRIQSDSELLVKQMQGHYKVKSSDLRPLYERALKLSRSLAFFSIEHVLREQNRYADRLANEALDRTSSTGGPQDPIGRVPHRDTFFSGKQLKKEDFEDEQKYVSRKAAKGKTIRARYVRGVLEPLEPLELPDGSEVELTLHRSQKN